jgi:hypothetical protein
LSATAPGHYHVAEEGDDDDEEAAHGGAEELYDRSDARWKEIKETQREKSMPLEGMDPLTTTW